MEPQQQSVRINFTFVGSGPSHYFHYHWLSHGK
jgi:hypothetical protein